MTPIRITRNILQVFVIMLRNPAGQHYALELSRDAKVSVGTIYSVLARLEQHGLVVGTFEDIDPAAAGRPARRYYTFTPEGRRLAHAEVAAVQAAFAPGGTLVPA